MTKYQEQKLNLLLVLSRAYLGAENYISNKELEKILNTDGRVIRKIVNALRCEGYPIGSNTDGYFYAQNVEEVEQTISQLLKRIKNVINATEGLVISQKAFR